MKRAVLLVSIACIAGCSFIPPYERPATQTPAGWRTTTGEAASLADLAWWTLYQDPELQQLIRIALAENNDLAIAVQRVEEARARYGMDRAKLFPQIGAQATNINSTSIGSYGFLVGLSWEIDLFGRLRALTEAAQHEYLASAQAQRAVYVSLIAEVASNYLMLRDQD
ncbi:MAG: TolC family protein, partial [Casimicrobiaceae bacterium]